MKKTVILSSALVLTVMVLLMSGCSKSNSSSESWIWKGTNYSAASATTGTGASNGTLSVVSTSPAGSMQVYFFNGLPTTSGMDTVVAWGTAVTESQVSISLGAGTNTYYSTGGNGSNQFVMVNVSGGKVSVSTMAGSPVEMLNVASNSTDSSGVTFSIKQ